MKLQKMYDKQLQQPHISRFSSAGNVHLVSAYIIIFWPTSTKPAGIKYWHTQTRCPRENTSGLLWQDRNALSINKQTVS